jgi:hypothetical protein
MPPGPLGNIELVPTSKMPQPQAHDRPVFGASAVASTVAAPRPRDKPAQPRLVRRNKPSFFALDLIFLKFTSIIQSYEPTASAAAQSERENNHVRASPAWTTNTVKNQAGSSRGGGVGGDSVNNGADELRSPVRKKWLGGLITKAADSSEYSSRFNSGCASDLFSDCRCFASCRHKGQGCLPSKVLVMASDRHSVRALFASIVAHATDCSIAQ